MFTWIYIFVGILVGNIGYALAHQQGRIALRWGWACALLIFPLLFLVFGKGAKSATLPAMSTEKWDALATHDGDIRSALDRLASMGPRAQHQFRETYQLLDDKSTIPTIISDIEQRWAEYSRLGVTPVEVHRGIDVMIDQHKIYHVEGQQTRDLSVARSIASVIRAKRRP